MSRTTIVVLVAIGAALAGFALSTNARRLQDAKAVQTIQPAAGPQQARLGWREIYGEADEQLVFSVDSLEVLPGGWRARVALENDTSVSYELASASSAVDPTFGLMLFESGEDAELEERNESDTLPAVRRAIRFQPTLPLVLEPGRSWTGTISAAGALVAGSWARVVFGPLVSVGSPPEGVSEHVVWITDRAHPLRP